MQAITVKYIGPTEYQGSRLKARCRSGNVTVGWKYELGDNENYLRAAKELLNKLGWEYNLMGGINHNGEHVFILTSVE